MRRLFAFTLAALVSVPLFAQSKTRIGVYDSRLVALAYYNSAEHRADKEHHGPALQSLAHYQVFSNSSIPNIIDKLKTRLPAIAREAGVALIVSKWDIAHAGDGVEYVDVTDKLVAELKPDAKVQKWIADMRNKEPMPLLSALEIKPQH